MRSFPLGRVYGLLEPGPVVMVTTRHKQRNNIMTMSWHTMMEFEPPLIGCVISNRNHSFECLKKSRECAIAIPTVELAPLVVKVGNVSGNKTDKFSKFKIATLPGSIVEAPLVAACYANLECRVYDMALVNRYNFFVLEVVKAWINRDVRDPRTIHHMGNGLFMVAWKKIRLSSRMK